MRVISYMVIVVNYLVHIKYFISELYGETADKLNLHLYNLILCELYWCKNGYVICDRLSSSINCNYTCSDL